MQTLDERMRQLEQAGSSLTLVLPDRETIRIGTDPNRARVLLRERDALDALLGGDHLRLAEAYLSGAIEVEGDLTEAMRATDALDLEASRWSKLAFRLRFFLGNRRRFNRESIAFHYDRPPEFFLPWLDRWRSYSHGFYRSPDDDVSDAQARKLQYAIDQLALKPGMHVLDMGAGWGCFLEYAGLQGIEVHGITISEEQFRFARRLIEDKGLPCKIELVDLLDFRPDAPFDAAVFMGTFEHFPDYPRAARFLRENLVPGGRLYTDFCAQRESFQMGAFMAKHIWPGTATYVNVPKLLDALIRAGFNIHVLEDDTLSYAYTVRAWGDALERAREALAERFGEPTVRAFLLFLRGSQHFLRTNRSQAYHLVAGLSTARLRNAGSVSVGG